MKKRIKPLKGKVNRIQKFNKDLEHTNFLADYQEIMIQRLNLNYINRYHEENIDRIVRSVTGRPKEAFNTDIKDGLLLTCNIEPEFYINIQNTVKKITGNYMPMNELIYLLLGHFCHVYNKKLVKKSLPFKQIYKGKSKSNLIKFNRKFSKYYKNIVKNFLD